MRNQYGQVPRADIPRSSFNLSHRHLTAFDADYLVPIIVQDIIPGDTWNLNCSHFARLATPLYPIMDNLYIDTFYFFTPYRLLWDNWERFCGAQDDPTSSIDYTIPAVSGATSADMTIGSDFTNLADYMGLPHTTGVDLTEVSALPFRAYKLIYNDWFRAQDLQDTIDNETGNGPDDGVNDHNLVKRGKRFDYFTSCLPAPQKGDAVPLFSEAIVHGPTDGTTQLAIYDDDTGDTKYMEIGATNLRMTAATGTGETTSTKLMYAQATDTINDLRLAFQTQRLLERDARSGTRYVETLLAHWGVTVPDFRLQRPEFLGGGSTPVNINPVANTTAVDSVNDPATTDRYPGNLSAFGTSYGKDGFTKSFVEHGVLIGLANLRGDITYSQGMHRYWNKTTRYDFYYPVLAQIGEQAVLNKEIYYDHSTPDGVFGYNERYAEYRSIPSRISSIFRPDNAASLEAWHLSEEFTSDVSLGSTFIQANTATPLDRAIAVNTEPHVIADFYFDINAARPMPMYGVPGNLDHF